MGELIDKQRLLVEARKLKSAITGRDKPFPVADAFMDVIEKRPETHEERTETHACDCISRQAAIDELIAMREHIDARMSVIGGTAYEMAIEALRERERKKGKWQWCGNHHLCSECDEWALTRWDEDECDEVDILTDFCPNCGADMRGEQDG